MGSTSDYFMDPSHFPEFADASGYMYDGTSTDSSPSPVRVSRRFPTLVCHRADLKLPQLYSQLDASIYEPFPTTSEAYQSYEASPTDSYVEFTDLTAPYNEDRRRRRPNATKDKQSISSMHMVSDTGRKMGHRQQADCRSVAEHKTERRSAPSANGKRNTHRTCNANSTNWNPNTRIS